MKLRKFLHFDNFIGQKRWHYKVEEFRAQSNVEKALHQTKRPNSDLLQKPLLYNLLAEIP